MLSAASAGSQRREGFGEQRVAVFRRAAFLDVGEVRLVRLVLAPARGVLPVLTSWATAPGAVPEVGGLGTGLDREARAGLVRVLTEVRHDETGGGVAALGLAGGSSAYTRSADRTTTSHESSCKRRKRSPENGRDLLDQTEQHDRGEPHESKTDREAVEVALSNTGAARAAGDTSTEHV